MEIVFDIIIFEESKKRYLFDFFIFLVCFEIEKLLSFNFYFMVFIFMLEKILRNNLLFNDRLLIEFFFLLKL